MRLYIKSIFIVIFCFTKVSFAQSQENDIQTPEQQHSWTDDHYINFHLGIYQPISIGNNFANKGLSHNTGFEASAQINLGTSKLLLGFKYVLFYSDVSDIEFIGDYDRSEIGSFNLILGYHFIRTLKWRAKISIGAGVVQYNNIKESIVFSDSGKSLWIIPSIQYHFNKTVGVYFSTSYRRDGMHIDTDEANEDFFNAAHYINLGLGLSIVL